MSGFLLVSPGNYLLINGSGDRLLLGDAPAPPAPQEQAGAGLLPNIRRMIAERERLYTIEQERLRRENNTALVSIRARASVFVSANVENGAEVAIASMSARAFMREISQEAVAQMSIRGRLGTFSGAVVSARRDDDELAFLLRLL